MRLHRFIGDFIFSPNEVKIENEQNIKQIKDVLRLKTGDFLILSDGISREMKVQIIEINKKIINTKIIEKIKPIKIDKKVSLYLSILKKENFELAIEKAVEIGVEEIIPTITERTIKTNINEERLRKIIKEASEQCGRSTLPKLNKIMKFKDAIIDGKKNEEKIFYDLNDEIKEKSSRGLTSQTISIFVGPEGGFTENENNFAKENGYKIASLGKLTLRAETAAIVGVYKAINQ